MAERPGGRLLVLLGVLYFAQGLPAGLLAKSLPAIAREAGLSREYIGLLALAALPWALKFLWAPWVDRLGSGRVAHRKRWIIAAQFGAVAVLLTVGSMDRHWLFSDGFPVLLGLLFLLNLCFATHDIASDGLAVRLLAPSLRGPGNSLQTGGYKVGMIVGGAGLLLAGGALGWQGALGLTSVLLLLLLLPVVRFAEPPEPVVPRARATTGWWWKELAGFWRRPGMAVWLMILLGYRVGDSLGSRMIKPALVDAGWSLPQVGMLDLVASLSGLAGAVAGGLLLLRMPRVAALVTFGLLQALGLAGWSLVNHQSVPVVLAVAVFEQLADGLSTVALFTMMMDRCRSGHEGTDYTLQACLVLLASGSFTLASGFSAAWLDYPDHFLLSAALGAIAILPALLWRRLAHV